MSGIWLSEEDVIKFKGDHVESEHKNAMVTQLQFRKFWGARGRKKSFNNRLEVKHNYTVLELQENLIDIIQLNKELENENEETTSITYRPIDQVSIEIKKAKEAFGLKLEEKKKYSLTTTTKPSPRIQ